MATKKKAGREKIHPRKIYTMPEAAAVSGLSESRLYKAIDAGELQASRSASRSHYTEGDQKMVRGSDLARWLRTRSKPGGRGYDLKPVRRKPEREGRPMSERTAAIVEALLAGEAPAAIAARFKMSPGSVAQIKLRELECEQVPQASRTPAIPSKRKG